MGAEGGEQRNPAAALARFRQVYASRDGRFAAYEDAAGHWTSVNTEKLAAPSSESEDKANGAAQESRPGF